MTPRRAVAAFRTVCAALLLIGAIAAAQSVAAGEASPAAFVQELGNDALKELTGPAVLQSERDARFRQLLLDRFDMAAISKFVLGRYWRSASEAQRAEFQDLFVDFIVNSYSERFSEYLGEGVKVTGANAEDDGTTLVRSKIDMPSAEDVRLDWRLRAADGKFVIVDIIVEGVSMDVTQRSQFASIIQDRGVNGLIEALRTND